MLTTGSFPIPATEANKDGRRSNCHDGKDHQVRERYFVVWRHDRFVAVAQWPLMLVMKGC